jgi:hypothetical protein
MFYRCYIFKSKLITTVKHMNSHPLSYEQFKDIIRYEPETGNLFWLPRSSEYVHHTRVNSWNSRNANRLISTIDSKGYVFCSVLGKQYRAHRVAWLLVYGEWPDVIDHINGVRTDNRLINLRSVNSHTNHLNQKLNSKNTSGVSGVYFNKNKGIWCAQMKFKGRTYHLGSTTDFFDAVCMRKSEERRLGFSLTHGVR